MRLLLTVLITALIISSPCLAGDNDIIEIPGAAGHRWSPNGHYLSYHLQGKLWVFEVGSGKHTEVSTFHARKYEWLNDSQFVFLKEWHEGWGHDFTRHAELIYVSLAGAWDGNAPDSVIKRTSQIGGRPALYSDNFGTVVLLMNDSTKPLSINEDFRRSLPTKAYRSIYHCPDVRGNDGRDKDRGQIWLVDESGEKLKLISDDLCLILPVLAPNGLLTTGTDQGGYTRILDTSGVVIAKLYHADHECWSPNSDVLYYSRAVQGDGDIVGGDLFRYTVSSGREDQVTFTPDIVEHWPRPSADGKYLAYRTYHKEPDGLEILLLEGGSHE